MTMQEKRERIFLILAAIFISSMAMLNIIGISRFIQIGPFSLPVGVLPYPITFLCTDIVSEIYGKKRASFLVWVGLCCNLFVLTMIWLAGLIPSVSNGGPPWQVIPLAPAGLTLSNGETVHNSIELYQIISTCTLSSVGASMAAYLLAQFADVHLFHYWKKLTKGKHLWLRNNGSTMISQLIDTASVIAFTLGPVITTGNMTFQAALNIFYGSYAFKFCAALLDTLPFYYLVRKLNKYLKIDSEK